MAARALRLALCLALAACTSLNPFSDGPTAKLTETELRQQLSEFVQVFTSDVESAADTISRGTEDRTIRRRTLTWKIQANEVGQNALLVEPPMSSFVDLWTLTLQMREFFTTGEGSEIFADQQDAASSVARDQVDRIETLGARLLPEHELDTARDEVSAFAAANPIRSLRSRVTNRPSKAPPGALSRLESVLTLPLAPFRVFRGVNEGAEAVRDFAAVADRFTNIVRSLPEQAAWQTQLLLYDVEDRETLRALIASMQEVSASSARMADTADRLPEELRATLDRLAGEQPELRATLTEAREVARESLAALERADAVSQSLGVAAGEVARAGAAWEDTAHAFGFDADLPPRAEPEQPPADGESGGFDLETLGTSARDVTAAAVELRGVIEDFDRVLRGEAVGRLDAVAHGTVDQSAVAMREWTDHAFWRGVQLLGLAFVAALAYRWITRPARRAHDAASPGGAPPRSTPG